MKKIWRIGAAGILAAVGFAGSAAAQEGDPEAGRIKASTCMGCHGIEDYSNVYPTFAVPRLGGQHADYIESALKAYRDGQRNHPTMNAQASSLSDQDMADIAAYLSESPGE